MKLKTTFSNQLKKFLRRAFFRPLIDNHGSVVKSRFILGALNQRIIESGVTPFWVFTADECRQHWRAMDNSTDCGGNRPEDYASKSPAIVDYLIKFWTPEVTTDHRIMEVGCNAGGNLSALHNRGYQKLSGIEINPNAVAHLRQVFPQLQSAVIHQGDAESVFSDIESGSIDIVFTMAVAIHIHPKSNSVFDHIARVSRKYIVSVEAEVSNDVHFFVRNYQRVYERLGFKQVRCTVITPQNYPELHDYWGYTARLFRR